MHPIAEIVVDTVLKDEDRRVEEFSKCLRLLNVDYAGDQRAFNQMIRSRNLLSLFTKHQNVKYLFDMAKEAAGDSAFLLHQKALYEKNRPGGDLDEAAKCLEKGQAVAQGRMVDVLAHTDAELHFARAKTAKTDLLRKKYLDHAVSLCTALKRTTGESHPYHTIAKIGIFQLECALEADSEYSDKALEQMLRDVEQSISSGLQLFPNDDYLLSAKAQLAQMLAQTSRAVQALQKAAMSNPRNAYVATTLARLHEQQGRRDDARLVLRTALEVNGDDRQLNYAFAKLRIEDDDVTSDEMLYHLRKAVPPHYRNLDAQLLLARQVYLVEGNAKSRPLFDDLAAAPVSSGLKRQLLYPLDEVFYGRIARFEADYGFVSREPSDDWVYFHQSNVEAGVWRQLRLGERVSYRVAFTFRGPSADNMELSS